MALASAKPSRMASPVGIERQPDLSGDMKKASVTTWPTFTIRATATKRETREVRACIPRLSLHIQPSVHFSEVNNQMPRQANKTSPGQQAEELTSAVCQFTGEEGVTQRLFSLLHHLLLIAQAERSSINIENVLWYARRRAFSHLPEFDRAVEAYASGYVAVDGDDGPDNPDRQH
jgi:hypothetical protein